MKTFKLRVLVDIEEDVFRDIELRADHTFENLHHAIIKAFDFFGDQMASFYASDENWEKGEEIVLMDMGFEGPSAPPVMSKTTLESKILVPDQKYLYVYDFLRMWIFYIECIEMGELVEGDSYPAVRMAFGNAPTEYSKKIPDDLGLVDPFAAGGDALWEEENLEDEIGGMFESLEDYDEF